MRQDNKGRTKMEASEFPKNESEADPSAGTKYEIVLNAEKKKGEMRCSQRMSHVINLELNSTIEA